MKKRKFLMALIAGTLALSMSISATAATWEDIDDFDKLYNAFQDTETEVHIILSGNITNENADMLTANIGQTYTIDGKEYTLTDVYLGGEGDVIINADVEGSENDNALNTYDNVNVTVNGNIDSIHDCVDANDMSFVVVNGNITAEDGDGIDADDAANVTVNGDVHGGHGSDGVDASDDTVVIVNGDVYGGNGQKPDKDGNLFQGNMSDPDGFSDGGAGVEADKNAQVKVEGNVYGGDAYGTYGMAGAGIDAIDYAKVEISGSSQGGNQIADPSVAPNIVDEGTETEYVTSGLAGDGVYMSGTADVTVGGSVTGGDANGQKAVAGCGAYIELTFTANVTRDPETGEAVTVKNIPGQLTVKGTVNAGNSTGKNGIDGVSVFYTEPYDPETGEILENPIRQITDEQIETICSSENLTYVRYSVTDSIPRMIFSSGQSYMDVEQRRAYQDEYYQELIELAKAYGVDTDTITELKDMVDTIPDEKIAEFAKEAFGLCNEILQKMSSEVYAVPKVTIGGLEETKEPIGSNPQKSDTPSTGDSSIPQVMAAVMILSAAVICGLVFRMKRKR